MILAYFFFESFCIIEANDLLEHCNEILAKNKKQKFKLHCNFQRKLCASGEQFIFYSSGILEIYRLACSV